MDALGSLAAAEVRAMIARKRTSAAAVARELGWPQSYIARRVDGRVAFTPAELAQVARVLGVSLAELLPREAHEVPPAAVMGSLAGLDLDSLQRIAAALGRSVADLLPVEVSAGGDVRLPYRTGTGRPARAGRSATQGPRDNRPHARSTNVPPPPHLRRAARTRSTAGVESL